MAKNMSTLDKIAFWLLVIGGLNWGLVGIGSYVGTNLNVVNLLLGSVAWLEALVYVLVGIAAILAVISCSKKK